MRLTEKWRELFYWKKGAIFGFLFIPILVISMYTIGGLIMDIFAMLRLETMAGILDALFMLPFVPMFIIHQKIGITIIPPILTPILVWTLIGASIGYVVDKRKDKVKVRR